MKKKLLSIVLTAAVVSSLSSFNEVFAQSLTAQKPSVKQNYSVRRTSNQLKADNFEDQKKTVFLHGNLSQKLQINEQSILAYLEQNKGSFLNVTGANNFKILSIDKDELGLTKVKVAQTIDGTEIRGSQIILHLDKDGVVKNIIGAVNKDYKKTFSATKSSEISAQKAISIAKKQFNYTVLVETPEAKKQVIVKNNVPTTVYSVNIHYNNPDIANWEVLIDATSGKVVKTLDKIRYDGASTGTGTAVDGSTKPLNLLLSRGTYELIDTTKPMTGQIKTYTANNREVEPGSLVTNKTNKFTTETAKPEVSAHYYAGVVYDFYKNILNRNSIDNKGMSIISTTHYDKGYDNAFWDGSQMVYGDGDGTEFTYFSGDLDVIGHELTHGVTQYTANLDYQDQSGALNESISDTFGVLISTYDKYNVKGGGTWKFNAGDWVVGQGLYLNNTTNKALRSLADPTLYDQPANMNDYVNTYDDNGGVHTNSGIPNKAAYLVAKSLGNNETAHIYYRALTNYLTNDSDFSGARNALESAASDLYGSSAASAVDSAFDTVGVSSSNN
ncbi:M4 family metallopeptidase [Clostridium felsineum]|uniref:Neutral metalloproteinase n=1 Tax=Clostridium felsineum TaxID=36839 RepID=A0A1S8L2Y7_9CLOT|nr:M4 family metallopeptidase [Clostridium felsineum]MCR3761888.1 M4 family metallopeptidase [Clostridium felsineum]URZ07441.1 Bacillolysin [Clostridium felsineum]URZ12472.1 Bacillolysin [Clostridium felsineum]